MKARVCFEFELEPETPDREASRDSYNRAASAAEEAIEHHLIGNGFLPDDLSLDCWNIGDVSLPVPTRYHYDGRDCGRGAA